MEDKWLTLEEFAEIARVHLDTARRYVREGKVEARKIGKRYLIKHANAIAFMEGAPVPYPKPPASENSETPRKSGTGTEGD